MKIFISTFEGKKRGVGDCPEATFYTAQEQCHSDILQFVRKQAE
jgi:hypothetical protein